MTVAERLCATPCGPAIEFAGIDLSLGGSRILDGVRLRVEAGSVHALVGPNGGGKSSLVKTLLGQMPHRGELRLEWPGAPGCIGYVPQALEFDRGLPLTVDDFMAAMCQRRPAFLGLSRSRRPAIDAAPGTGRHAGQARSAHGRPLRRRAPARAAGPGPGTAAATAGAGRTDVGPRRGRHPGLRAAAAGLAPAGVTVLWIEHDLEAVGRLADRVSGLNRHLLFDGPAASSLTPERLLTLSPPSPGRTRRPADERRLRTTAPGRPGPAAAATCRRPWPTASSSTRPRRPADRPGARRPRHPGGGQALRLLRGGRPRRATGVAIGILSASPYTGPYGSLFGYCLLFGVLLNYLAQPHRLARTP